MPTIKVGVRVRLLREEDLTLSILIIPYVEALFLDTCPELLHTFECVWALRCVTLLDLGYLRRARSRAGLSVAFPVCPEIEVGMLAGGIVRVSLFLPQASLQFGLGYDWRGVSLCCG